MNKKNVKNFIGKLYGRLTIIKEIDPISKRTSVLTLCSCGNEKEVQLTMLTSGHVISCGCYKKEIGERTKTHGLAGHPLYDIWIGMGRRCEDPAIHNYHNYGGRGINVCDEWKNDFKSFYDWCIRNGWRKGLQVDRYPNNNGNYSPTNCRIATQTENANNTRANVVYEVNGQKNTLSQLSDLYKINYESLRSRLRRGEFIEDALSRPVRLAKRRPEIKYAFGFIN